MSRGLRFARALTPLLAWFVALAWTGSARAQATFDTLSQTLSVPTIGVGMLEYRDLRARLGADGRLTVLGLTGPHSAEPRWIRAVKSSVIVPGQGLNSVRVGDTQAQIADALGTGYSFTPVNDLAGRFLYYTMVYRHLTYTTTLALDASRRMTSMRLIDYGFGASGMLAATVAGVGPGSAQASVRAAYGGPQRIDAHFTCPASVGADAVTLVYPGLSVAVCAGNDKAFWIDIP